MMSLKERALFAAYQASRFGFEATAEALHEIAKGFVHQQTSPPVQVDEDNKVPEFYIELPNSRPR